MKGRILKVTLPAVRIQPEQKNRLIKISKFLKQTESKSIRQAIEEWILKNQDGLPNLKK